MTDWYIVRYKGTYICSGRTRIEAINLAMLELQRDKVIQESKELIKEINGLIESY